MVKYGKKFFYDEDSKKSKAEKAKQKVQKPIKLKKENSGEFLKKLLETIKKILPLIGLIIIVVIILLCAKSCGNKKKDKPKDATKKENNVKVVEKTKPIFKETYDIEIYAELPKVNEIVENYEDVKTNNDHITYEDKNLNENKYTEIGKYNAIIFVNNKEYSTVINIVDSKGPELEVKDLTINEGNSYKINDFIASCTDNSLSECVYKYTDNANENKTTPGTYMIEIVATDKYGNESGKKIAKLTIKAKEVKPSNQTKPTNQTKPSNQTKPGNQTTKPVEQKSQEPTCEFGSLNFTDKLPIGYSVLSNNCPIDKQNAKSDTYAKRAKQLSDEDIEKLKQDFKDKNINLSADLQIDINPAFNDENKGLLGYTILVTIKDRATKDVKVQYALRQDKSRMYTVNKVGL